MANELMVQRGPQSGRLSRRLQHGNIQISQSRMFRAWPMRTVAQHSVVVVVSWNMESDSIVSSTGTAFSVPPNHHTV